MADQLNEILAVNRDFGSGLEWAGVLGTGDLSVCLTDLHRSFPLHSPPLVLR